MEANGTGGNPILHVEKDTVIYKQGQECSTMFLLRQGTVGLYLNYGTPEQFQLCELSQPDSSLGEMGLLDGEPRNATAVALTDAVLVEISEDKFGAFIAQNPMEARQIIVDLAIRFKNVTQELKNEQEVIRECLSTLQEQDEKKKNSFMGKLKKYTEYFFNIPKDVPPDLYAGYYNRFHGTML
ncbi:MAG: cyclic nucleotide-binding domain-containing protein [Sphaerochaeta sp.]|nr:cyclic nucleotide-binding domain-containing protein [Sphaerochaeta sp.]MCH3919100.1 cyclic nucleotide-binding domain-containing protein [Sphaerochaeta sp.]MCI2076492.1 cyclic nucleotide-binding domain-containing protein [Sphaerochaeta sp.]MCI2097542.1 cyclic nucleotide-binding domain-containing protein [Sphaerochaeta sp.]